MNPLTRLAWKVLDVVDVGLQNGGRATPVWGVPPNPDATPQTADWATQLADDDTLLYGEAAP